MGRKKKPENRDLPPNLYFRKKIYYYRDTRTGKEYSLGKNKSLAITETIQANLSISKPKISLVDRINNIHVTTLHEWLDTYRSALEKRNLRPQTLKDYFSKIGILKKHLTDRPLHEITTKQISDFINGYDKPSAAKQIRSTLSNAFDAAIASGIVEKNPVSVTKAPKTKVQRSRLTLENFRHAMLSANSKYSSIFALALLTGQRIGDIVNMKWSDIRNEKLFIEQSKTGAKIAIPVSLKLNAINLSIVEILQQLKNDSETICNTSIKSLRKNFAEAIPKLDKPPTFHEIRSLSARLYEEEKSAEFAKKILGHKSMVMTDKYLDSRNNEYTEL